MQVDAVHRVVATPPPDRATRIAGAGIGLRTCHIAQVLRDRPAVPWFELLADNHLADGGRLAAEVAALRTAYPLTLHCVGMNIAGVDRLDFAYLERVRRLRDSCDAAWISDHLCFTRVGERFYHELLPFPYTDEALCHTAGRVQAIQEFLGCELVIENVSRYVQFAASAIGEAEFLAELVRRTGCRLLLDVNNLYVNHVNLGEDSEAFVAVLPSDAVQEIHLGGHRRMEDYLLDAHDSRVSPPVWELYERVCRRLPEVPVLIEWDSDIPEFTVLQAEARHAAAVGLQRTVSRAVET